MDVVYIATVQICIKADNKAQASDAISEILSNEKLDSVIDWQYLKLNGQFLYPTEKYHVNTNEYVEGDAFN